MVRRIKLYLRCLILGVALEGALLILFYITTWGPFGSESVPTSMGKMGAYLTLWSGALLNYINFPYSPLLDMIEWVYVIATASVAYSIIIYVIISKKSKFP
jgi:membrane protein insertase Oxa1/YidC/SpoIIIJ